MKTLLELEQIVHSSSANAPDSVYTSLEELERGNLTVQGAYQEILECIAFDILKTPKK